MRTEAPVSGLQPRERPCGSPGEVLLAFLRLGFTSFGGPVAHLGYFRSELIEKRRWSSESVFAELIAISQSLPGPASSQVAFALGILRAGWLGGLAAWTGFTLPSALLMFCFSLAESTFRGTYAAAVLHGLQLAAIAVVGQAILAMRKGLAPDLQRLFIASVAFLLTTFLPPALSTIGAVAWGGVAAQVLLRKLPKLSVGSPQLLLSRRVGTLCLAAASLLFCVSLFESRKAAGPVAMLSSFYSSGALVFGGGHVVLPLLENSFVAKGWVTQQRFLSGYGAAQIMPGPLFTFAAFLGAALKTPLPTCVMSAFSLIALFLPGLLLMVAALAHWGQARQYPGFQRSLSGINASVLGVLIAVFVRPICTTGLRSATDMLIALALLVLAVRRIPALIIVALAVITAVLAGH